MIAPEPHAEGALLRVRAQPGARRNELRGEQDGALKICVTQVAERGKANKAIAEVLAKGLGLRKSQVELIAGDTASQKKFLIRGVSPDELAALLSEHQAGQTQRET